MSQKKEKILHEMTNEELVALYNKHADAKVGKFKDKATAVRKVSSLLSEKGIPVPMPKRGKTNPKAKAPAKDKKPSKLGLIREFISGKKSVTREEIMKVSGFDSRNAHTAMSILRNSERTKNPISFEYDRKTQTYTFPK